MKIVVHTLGCKVNQYESDSLQLALENRGYKVSNKLEKADIFVVNTCAVTNEAERKSRQTISKFRKLNPKSKIFVCGCASEKDSKNFINLKNVCFISGVANKTNIINKIEEFLKREINNKEKTLNNKEKITSDKEKIVSNKEKVVDDKEKVVDKKKIGIDRKEKVEVSIEELPTEYNEKYFSKPTRTRAFIKIQDGCNNFCSYCIIPYLRGRSRSRNLIEIINEIETFGEDVKEIVLTGIDISDYKIDNEFALGRLLKELDPKGLRIRLGSIEQGIINKEFIKTLTEVKNICPHFHLSLQSGSDAILKRMNRHYNTNQFLQTVKLLRKTFKHPAITTDIIIGFPGETEKEFKETVKFVKKVKFANIHIFPYSKREGTVAAKYKDINGDIKKRRVAILEKINKKLRKKYIKKAKKISNEVLIEEKEGEFFVGHTKTYIKCYIKEENLLPNSIVSVKLKEIYKDGVIAKIICKKGV